MMARGGAAAPGRGLPPPLPASSLPGMPITLTENFRALFYAAQATGAYAAA